MLILASQSASRRAMLEAAGVAFMAVPADVDERALEAGLEGAAPEEVARALARAKAQAVSEVHPGRWVLGSDSLVVCDGRRFDKPASRAQAAQHLRFFSGKVMQLHSAAALARDGEVKADCGDKAELAVRETATRLKTLLGRGPGAPAPQVSGSLLEEGDVPALPELRAIALASRPDLAALREDRQRAAAELRLQLAHAKIDYSLGAEYRRRAPAGCRVLVRRDAGRTDSRHCSANAAGERRPRHGRHRAQLIHRAR